MVVKVSKFTPIVYTDHSVSGETAWNRDALVAHISVFGLVKLPILIIATVSEWAHIFDNTIKMILTRW